jgi:hypothetical protein
MTKTVKEVRSLVKKYVTDCWPCVARQPIDLKKKYVVVVHWHDNGDTFAPRREAKVEWNARIEEGREWIEDTIKKDVRELLSKKYTFLKDTKRYDHYTLYKYTIEIGNIYEILYDIEDTFGVYKDKLTCYTENWRGKKDPTPDEIIDGILDARHEAAKNTLKEVLKDKGVKKAVKKALENLAKK